MMPVMERIAIRRSALIAFVLIAVHGAAGGVLWLVTLPAGWAWPVGGAIALSLGWLLARDAMLVVPRAIVALELREGGQIACVTRDGGLVEGTVLPSTYVSAWVTVVNVRPRARRRARSVILVPGNVDPAAFRRLRTWLKWKGADVNPVTPGQR